MTDATHSSDSTDPIAIVFPGQGSQAPGMGKLVYEHSPAARLTFEEASDITSMDLAKSCFDSTEDDLATTHNTQPAVLTTSVAIIRAMREKLAEVGDTVRPRLFGGHSQGLFSAAVAAGALSFRDGLQLMIERGRLMGEFNAQRPVGMAAILGLTVDRVRDLCTQATEGAHSRVDVANMNDETQIVISGDVSALERAMELAKEARAKAIRLRLKVSSHTPLHDEQADEFADIMRSVPIEAPDQPIVSNITADLLRTAAEVRAEFEAQLRSPVLWAENVRRMTREGVELLVEVGPGHVLAGMAKRISKELNVVSLDDAREAPIPISVLPGRAPLQTAQ
ncbi:MAG: ACP S-malonyltransferase [Dehalococcoidia bacterium]